MVFCTYCGQSFTRDEHLERHILTHTNVKPFKCFTCHMSFARRDLLQRHYTVHGKDQNQQEIPASSGIIPKSAGRTPIACSNCAKTKTKCDKKFPCSRCAGRNLRCTLRPTRRATKNAVRVGIPPESAVSIPPGAPNVLLESATSQSPLLASSPRQPHIAWPAGPHRDVGLSPKSEVHAAVLDTSASQFSEQPVAGLTPPDSLSPPVPTPGIVHNTPLSTYNEFQQVSKDSSDDGSSPRFMLDWSQIQMPISSDSMIHPQLIMNTDLGFDSNLSLVSHGDGMLSILPDLANDIVPLVTPLETPKFERSFSSLELSNPAAGGYPQRHNSAPSVYTGQRSYQDTNPEIDIAGQDAWSVFRCTRAVSSSSCPKTARLNLERLEETLRNHDSWGSWSPQWNTGDLLEDHLTVMQLHESTRDKLLAITQSFIHNALEIHKEGTCQPQPSREYAPLGSCASSYVLLPPARVLEYFLRSYANGFEQIFPLTSRGVLDANELMHCHHDRAASLLVLMMIAQGATSIPSNDARMLTGGLTEACRISLSDLIERNLVAANDQLVLHAALLLTVQEAWSGDKWQMDVAMSQRGIYLAMLRHSGLLDKLNAPAEVRVQANTDQLWSEWVQNESASRLIYSWVMVDQDLALFHDTAPLFSVTELTGPMPDTERLWSARSSAEWSSMFEQVHEFAALTLIGSATRPLSLRDLFRRFLDEEMITSDTETTPLQLRLLLHPLQALVCQYSQLLSCFSDASSHQWSSSEPRRLSASSTKTRLEEVQSLLGRWFDLAERYLKSNLLCPMMQANLVVFHLISLNAVTNFSEIESLARRENFDGTYRQLTWIHQRCISDVEEAVYHCGQVFRLVRAMPRTARPPWWAGAIYRVALVLWTDSLTHKEAVTGSNTYANGLVPGPSFAIDALAADHPLIIRYLTKREGVPCVTKRDGSQMALDRAYPVLQHCVEVIDEGPSSRFSDGIRSKMERLARG